jgi:urease accessory protein
MAHPQPDGTKAAHDARLRAAHGRLARDEVFRPVPPAGRVFRMYQTSPLSVAPAAARAVPPASQRPVGWEAQLALRFERRDRRTVLAARRHQGPLVVQRPLYEAGEGQCQVVIVHPPGGIAGGDRLEIDVHAAEGAHAVVTTPGAAKWYRSAGAWAAQNVAVRVAQDAVVEWLPQETIVFDGSRARMAARIELAPGALFIGWEVLCFGRTASGERFGTGALAQSAEVLLAGQRVFAEFAQVQGGSAVLDSRAGLAGFPVSGTMLIAGRDAGGALLDAMRSTPAPADTRAGISTLPGVTVARILAHSAHAARDWFVGLWEHARPALIAVPAVRPRIWRC